jgi:hypothetical protein
LALIRHELLNLLGVSLADYLAHILEAIERIDAYTNDMTEVAFLEDRLVSFPCLSPTRCAMRLRTGISRWIWRLYGPQFNAICLNSTSRSRR